MASLVAEPAVRLAAVPVMFVPTKAEGVPNAGVTNVGLVANTAEPVPVSSVKAAAKLALDGVAKNVATPVPKPDTPEEIGRAVQLVKVPDAGVPRIGVTKVGLVANTLAPDPVSSVSNAARLVLDGVAKNVAAPAARPETPDAIGRPVQFVKVPDAGVPNIGVTSVGVVDNTLLPVPVIAVAPVPPLATAKLPARVMAPDKAPDGVNPVVPALKEVTPAEIAPI